MKLGNGSFFLFSLCRGTWIEPNFSSENLFAKQCCCSLFVSIRNCYS